MEYENLVYIELDINKNNVLYKWYNDHVYIADVILKDSFSAYMNNFICKHGYFHLKSGFLLDIEYDSGNLIYNKYYDMYKELNREYNLKQILTL